MIELSYADLSRKLHRGVSLDRVPAKGTIEVTRRCPLVCAHCYNNLPMGDAQARREELSLEEHRRILDEITEAGCLWLLFSGGEIFARPDFLEIYTHAKRNGLLITLFTNATLISPRIADYLAEWRPFSIEVTLYGRTRETYERLTRDPGSYDRCLRGIQLLQERGLPLKLKTVGVTINKHEIWDMQRFAEEELGVEFKFDSMINPRVDCSQSPLAVRLQPEEIVALDLADAERVQAWRDLLEHTGARAAAPERAEEVYHCGGGVSAFAIDPYGKLSICVLSEQEKFDLRRGSFAEGWGGYLRGVRAQPRTRPTKCVRCALKSMCGMCPAMGELESGHKETPVDFLCRTAHLRAHAVGAAVPEHGECEYCNGGSAEQELRELAADLERHVPKRTLPALSLPMLATPSAMGCGSGCEGCGAA